jgi:flavin reductase (DIM6/NTAB) family NADH-FMN oxidoreductase RutF
MNKETIPLHTMWHIDSLMHVYPVTIVTTVDSAGTVNAAPYSLVLPFCSSGKTPQMLLISNKAWHTARNILTTREFVINYPRADQVRDIVETSRFYPEGVNELLSTRYTTGSARHVAPPLINECYQHIECRVREILEPGGPQLNVIADIVALSMDEGMYALPRAERARSLNPPVYLGVDENMHHIFGAIDEIAPVEVDLLT